MQICPLFLKYDWLIARGSYLLVSTLISQRPYWSICLPTFATRVCTKPILERLTCFALLRRCQAYLHTSKPISLKAGGGVLIWFSCTRTILMPTVTACFRWAVLGTFPKKEVLVRTAANRGIYTAHLHNLCKLEYPLSLFSWHRTDPTCNFNQTHACQREFLLILA